MQLRSQICPALIRQQHAERTPHTLKQCSHTHYHKEGRLYRSSSFIAFKKKYNILRLFKIMKKMYFNIFKFKYWSEK